uniref:CHCH domain-containing protein n=1 Tax=Aegilops tauschii TaxID=37682 RepID=M8CX75_AEGTA
MAAAHAAEASPTHRASIQATSTPPYPSAARIADSSCFPQYTASLKCLETNHQDKSKCQQQFDDYKECKKREKVHCGMECQIANEMQTAIYSTDFTEFITTSADMHMPKYIET